MHSDNHTPVPAPSPSPSPSPAMAIFPVILYDGERETNMGTINIHQDLAFKQFQTMLSQIIGISYNNLTTYLIDTTKPKLSPDRRKILITHKTNFVNIVKEQNCCFLVVLKRSRRHRRRKIVNQSDWEWAHGLNSNNYYYYCYYFGDAFQDLLMYGLYGGNYSCMDIVGYPYEVSNVKLNRLLCEECKVAEKHGIKDEFHLCVYDEVVVGGFRSPAGPVARPAGWK